MPRDVPSAADASAGPSGAFGAALGVTARVALALLPASLVGALVQRGLSFDLLSFEGLSGPWLLLLWPTVLLGLGFAAVGLVALPVGWLFGRLPGRWRVPVALVACEVIVGTVLFRLVSLSIACSWSETLLVALPQLAFFAAYHGLGGGRGATRQSP